MAGHNWAAAWLTLLFGIVQVGCGSSADSTKPSSVSSPEVSVAENGADKTVALPVPAVPESPFLNVEPQASKVGGQRCAECHAEQASAFQATRHSRSMSLPENIRLVDGELHHEKSGYHYTATTAEALMEHSESIVIDGNRQPPVTYAIEYVIGSGRFGHSFLSKPDQYRVQAPLTWYSTRQCWDMSPGYDFADQLSFRRVVSARCLYCHAGNVQILNQNEFDFAVHETAISCERCHGPGSIHAEQHAGDGPTGTPSGVDYSIVNPIHLTRELSESVCQQCHLQGDAQIPVRGQRFDSFRPGQTLAAFRQDFRVGSSTQMTIVGHVEQMHSSLCYQKSETLTCITCHKPHHSISDEQLPQHYRRTCLSCHDEDKCAESPAIRQSVAQDQCVKCHMPAAPTEVPHVAFTHHRIGIHSPEDPPVDARSTSLFAMLPEQNVSAADAARTRGLAWLHVALSNPEVDYQQALKSAQEDLSVAWDGGAGDAEVASGLARIATEISWHQQSELWAERALKLDKEPSDARMNALSILSELQFSRQKDSQALAGFSELTKLRRDARHWFYRGMTEQNMKNSDQAILSLEQSLVINPRNPGTHAVLAAIYQVRKDDAKANYHREMSARLGSKH